MVQSPFLLRPLVNPSFFFSETIHAENLMNNNWLLATLYSLEFVLATQPDLARAARLINIVPIDFFQPPLNAIVHIPNGVRTYNREHSSCDMAFAIPSDVIRFPEAS